MNVKRFLLLLSLVPLVASAACQNATPALPTIAALPTSALTAVQATAQQTESEATAESGLISTVTPLFLGLSADQDATQNAMLISGFTPQPTTDIASLSGTSNLTNVVTGDTISLVGTLTIENDHVTVTDTNGSHVIVDIPIQMAESMVNEQVYVIGTVSSTDGNVSLQLLTIQQLGEPPIDLAVDLPSAEGTPESTLEPLPTIATNIRLGANLTALTDFDQLMGQIAGAQLGDRQWIAVSGNPSAGWSFSFYSPSANDVIIYNVLPDGSLQNQLGIPPIEATEGFTLSRNSLTVDSDDVLTLYIQDGGTEDVDTIVLLLQAIDINHAQWSILDAEGHTIFTVDALSGAVTQ